MNRKHLLIAVALIVAILIALLWPRPEEDVDRGDDLPPIGLTAPPEWQERFRRMEEGELEDMPVDEVLDEFYPGGINNGPGR